MTATLSECQAHMRAAEDRPERMRDWLIRMINSGRFPGLEWLDEAKTIFRVPWIHAKKRGYCKERDAALFREWAVHSGKYRDEGDPTVWKINFRCAINGLKDILEMKDLQTEDCRVYKVLPSRSRRSQRKHRSRFPTTEPYCYPLQVSPGMWGSEDGSSCYQPPPPPAYISGIKMEFEPPTYPSQPHNTDIPAEQAYYYQHSPAVISPLVALPTIVPPFIPLRREDSPDSGYGQNSPAQPVPAENPFVASTSNINNACPFSMTTCNTPSSVSSFLGDRTTEHDEEILQLVGELEDAHPPATPPSPHPHSLSVRILYGSILVHKAGHPLHPRLPSLQWAPAQQIILPSNHPNHVAKDIFEAMTRGLVLEMVDNDIYATALCRTVVYYGSSACDQSYALEKEQRTKVFDYNNCFLPLLEKYALGQGPAPRPNVIFSLGQSWGPHRHAGQNLVSVVITHLPAEHAVRTVGLPSNIIVRDLLLDGPGSVEIEGASLEDLAAEAFLNQFSS
ncbi:hypothetical protein EMCRGX_G016266 [Ephydatia muelleri]